VLLHLPTSLLWASGQGFAFQIWVGGVGFRVEELELRGLGLGLGLRVLGVGFRV